MSLAAMNACEHRHKAKKARRRSRRDIMSLAAMNACEHRHKAKKAQQEDKGAAETWIR